MSVPQDAGANGIFAYGIFYSPSVAHQFTKLSKARLVLSVHE